MRKKNTKSFNKQIKLTTNSQDNKPVTIMDVKVMDAETDKLVMAIQSVKWKATPSGSSAIVEKLKFNHIEWVDE